MTSFFREHKTLLIVLAVGLLLLELEIFAVAAMKSGRKSTLQVFNRQGSMIYETDGRNLSDFNKYYFEKTFGPFQDHEVRLATREAPFPFRAWFVAAVGIPVGVTLLLGFLIQAYQALFGPRPPVVPPEAEHGLDTGPGRDGVEFRAERLLRRLGRLNIFALGFLILLAVLAYWILPNLVADMGRLGLETISRFRWVFLGLAIVLFGFFGWIVYLRYLLASRSIASRVEVEKYRLELEYRHGLAGPTRQLTCEMPVSPQEPVLPWHEDSGQNAP